MDWQSQAKQTVDDFENASRDLSQFGIIGFIWRSGCLSFSFLKLLKIRIIEGLLCFLHLPRRSSCKQFWIFGAIGSIDTVVQREIER